MVCGNFATMEFETLLLGAFIKQKIKKGILLWIKNAFLKIL